MSDNPRPLSEKELEDWERWSGREIDWKPEDVRRLVATVQEFRARLRLLDSTISLAPHGGELYQQAVAIRYEVLRKPLGLQFTPEQLAAEAPYTHLALIAGGQARACLYLMVKPQRQVQIRQVAVAPECQRMGYGKKLMGAAESLAAQFGAKESILDARQAAIPFYERLGYSSHGELFIQLGTSHQTMRKKLG